MLVKGTKLRGNIELAEVAPVSERGMSRFSTMLLKDFDSFRRAVHRSVEIQKIHFLLNVSKLLGSLYCVENRDQNELNRCSGSDNLEDLSLDTVELSDQEHV